MAQPKLMEKPPDCGAVHVNVTPGEFDAELIEHHFAIPGDTGANPFAMRRRQLDARRMGLSYRRKRTSGAMQGHHVVDKFRRHPEMQGCLPMAVAFLYKPNNTRTQFDRMRLAPWRLSSPRQSESQICKYGKPESQ